MHNLRGYDEKIVLIRRELDSLKTPNVQFAGYIGVSRKTISKIVKGN